MKKLVRFINRRFSLDLDTDVHCQWRLRKLGWVHPQSIEMMFFCGIPWGNIQDDDDGFTLGFGYASGFFLALEYVEYVLQIFVVFHQYMCKIDTWMIYCTTYDSYGVSVLYGLIIARRRSTKIIGHSIG